MIAPLPFYPVMYILQASGTPNNLIGYRKLRVSSGHSSTADN
jgi:hypothetical protein